MGHLGTLQYESFLWVMLDSLIKLNGRADMTLIEYGRA